MALHEKETEDRSQKSELRTQETELRIMYSCVELTFNLTQAELMVPESFEFYFKKLMNKSVKSR